MLVRGGVGYALFWIGGATLTFTGGRYATGAWRQQEARLQWQEAEARSVVAFARHAASADARASVPTVTGAPVARLLIPRLGLDEIVLEGVDDDVLNAGPGHLPGSALPGEQGNAVISAHRDRHFSRLSDLRVGDTVVTESAARRARWVVISTHVIDADAPALFRTREATLTLTTCWPIRYFGSAPNRLILTAKPVASS